jgi:hypothetical protein
LPQATEMTDMITTSQDKTTGDVPNRHMGSISPRIT